MKNSSYNETDVVKVEYRCPRCKEKTITNFKYLTSILTEKDAIILAKKSKCKKCKER